jgi:hypothetical protein
VDDFYDDILSPAGLNSLIFDDPYAKLCFVGMLASHYCLKHWRHRHQSSSTIPKKEVIYIDLDSKFTAYVKAGLLLKWVTKDLVRRPITTSRTGSRSSIIEDDHKSIKIYLAAEGEFESILEDVLATMSESCIVIFDSVNSFYNLYYRKINLQSGRNLSNMNHLLSIFLMLLVKHGLPLDVPILATSMIRYKKTKDWIQLPSSNRLLRAKSAVKLYVEMTNECDISVRIINHPVKAPGKIIFHNQGIKV